MGKLTAEVFNESCCDGGAGYDSSNSCQPCGCDKGANWTCAFHREFQAVKPTPVVVPAQPAFVVKDSGQRQVFESGMQRDTSTGKTDYSLIADGPMFDRWAEHLTKGAKKYEARNWMKAAGDEELQRFRISAFRHFMQWFRGETDEDHASALYFNVNGAEYVREKLTK